MRDYKNVKVPGKYRTHFTRVEKTAVKRASATRVARTRVPKAGAVLLKMFMAVMVFGMCFLGWRTYLWTERTGLFQITGVDVKGVRQLAEEDVKAIAGVFTGQNIFKADIQEAAQRARANPWVKEVKIERKLPNRIGMVIEERMPAVILETPAGRYLAAGDGVVIARLGKDGHGAWLLPVVSMKAAADGGWRTLRSRRRALLPLPWCTPGMRSGSAREITARSSAGSARSWRMSGSAACSSPTWTFAPSARLR